MGHTGYGGSLNTAFAPEVTQWPLTQMPLSACMPPAPAAFQAPGPTVGSTSPTLKAFSP